MSISYAKVYSISTIIFCIDRLTKCIAYHMLATTDFIFCKYISFSLTYNTGIAWSLFADAGAIVEAGIVLITSYFLYEIGRCIQERKLYKHSIIGECLVIAGGVSNVCDRCIYPGVVDFIKLSAGEHTFPIFNVADVSVCVGIVIIVYQHFFDTNDRIKQSL